MVATVTTAANDRPWRIKTTTAGSEPRGTTVAARKLHPNRARYGMSADPIAHQSSHRECLLSCNQHRWPRRARFTGDIAADGVTAIQRVRTSAYDLMTLDIMLPGIDGLAVCGEVEELPDRVAVASAVLVPLVLIPTSLGGLIVGRRTLADRAHWIDA